MVQRHAHRQCHLVSVALGPWLVAVGLVTMVAAGLLLVLAAARARQLAANTLWDEPDPTPQSTRTG